MKVEKEKLDPVIFAVIKARIDGVINKMGEVLLRTSRNPILYGAKDFTCSVFTHDAKLLTLVNSIPILLLSMQGALRAVVECFKDDIHPGDCFANNDPYYGVTHVGDWEMFVPIFYEGKLVCWVGNVCHLIDTGAHIASNLDPLAKDVYEEAIHFPPLRMAKDYKEIPDIIRLIKANFRYPDQWYGDFLAQIGSVWVGEREIHKMCDKYGADVFNQFQDDYLDYGDRRMTEEIKKLPKGEWSIEALSEKMEPVCPEGVLLKLKMSIDPDEAIITFDLTEMPDQLPWGLNLSEATSKGACIEGVMPSLDPTLPVSDGVFRHFNFILREGAVAGIPKWPVGTSFATTAIADIVANMVLNLWEQVEPGRGHAGSGYETPGSAILSGTDFRRNNAPYGANPYIFISGGGASNGCDGWPNFLANCVMGNMMLESVELHELKNPEMFWEVEIQTDSGGAGKWRGAPASYVRTQPRHQTMTLIPIGIGLTASALGVAGGKPGCLADHWIEKHGTGEKTQQLKNTGVYQVKEDEDWVAITCGGGGYGDPLERDPEAVREDARNYIISLKAARDEYGVVLNTEPELYEVDYDATERLRAQLRKERRTK